VKFRVWVECPTLESETARLAGHAELINERDVEKGKGCHAAILSSRYQFDGAFMDSLGPQLQFLVRHGIGYDNVDVDAASERGILVANTPDAPTESTAEHTVTLLLAAARRLVVADRRIHGTAMDQKRMQGLELRGKTLGIVGFGRIGRRVAQICGPGLGMKVLAHDPYVSGPQANATLVPTLEAMLEAADVVTVNCALTPETRLLINEARMRRMKKGAVLVNTSRGPVVDEDALVRVLKDGHLAAAGVDVFHVEPPAATHPLFALDTVVATPHIASYTDGGLLAMGRGSVEQVLQVIRGEKPENLLNPKAWPGRARRG
jgi:D-3-phosphoglycerate dehydrogenase / 2-oxoglutarate reductase